ncbi:hypothetical protein LZK75_13065 [Rhizobium leguminosarum]|nr:hypothetical protein LZK75_13065 [Rhizobium leguminosarum]
MIRHFFGIRRLENGEKHRGAMKHDTDKRRDVPLNIKALRLEMHRKVKRQKPLPHLENRRAGNRTVGSNPTSSAMQH